MTQIDQFESVFKAAAKTLYSYREVLLRSVLVVTDLDDDATQRFAARMQRFLRAIDGHDDVRWEQASAESCRTVGELIARVEQAQPDLVCTYRNLHSSSWKWPHVLGDHLEVLTQVATMPVLVVPRPDSPAFASATEGTEHVMAITDHLTGDERLVSHAARFTAGGGTVFLTHVEDEAALTRYLEVIAKIPEIDTDSARQTIRQQLLKEPEDYIGSCRAALREAGLPIEVESIVTVGRRLAHYKQLIERQRVDLLVLNTKDDDQLAMHGLAYPLAVELRDVALLML